MLKEPFGFLIDHSPHATTTISRTLAGVPCRQSQRARTAGVARIVADKGLNASVGGKWAKQPEYATGNPLVMATLWPSCVLPSVRHRRAGTNPNCCGSDWGHWPSTIPSCGYWLWMPPIRSGACAKP